MSYYMGDYYGRGRRGDYYRGDPFSLGGILSGIGKVAGGFLTGGVVGAATSAVGSIFGKSTSPAPTGIVPAVIPPAGGMATQAGLFGGAGGSGLFGLQPPPGQIRKKGIGAAISRILPGGDTGYMRRPRMNVTNPRALRRAIRRVTGFGKLVQRVKRTFAKANTAVGNKHTARRKGRFGR